MYAREFCYWLQGAFELGITFLNEGQRELVKKHLALVNATPQEGQPTEALVFCGWLGGVMDTMPDLEQAGPMSKVRVRLADVFEHVIDPSYKNAKKLTQIHGPGMRC